MPRKTAESGRRLASDQTNAMLALPKRVGINAPTLFPEGKGATRYSPACAAFICPLKIAHTSSTRRFIPR